MAKYWFGIVCECDDKGTFARKLRVFVASEAMLEDLTSYLKIVRRGSSSPEAPDTPRATEEPRIKRFEDFCQAKEAFIKAIEERNKTEPKQLNVDDACQEDEVLLGPVAYAALQKMKEHCGGAAPSRFMNGKVSSVRHGLKRWQGMVEMAHIYADSEDESMRGGGLLMPIELPVDKLDRRWNRKVDEPGQRLRYE